MTAIRTETLQAAAARWHARHYPDADAFQMMTKATEELGELARAIGGEHEGRPGRGVVIEEAVDVLFVIVSLIGRHYQALDVLGGLDAFVRAKLQADDETTEGAPRG